MREQAGAAEAPPSRVDHTRNQNLTPLSLRLLVLVVIAVAIFISGLMIGAKTYSQQDLVIRTPELPTVFGCIKDTTAQLQIGRPESPELLRGILEYCYSAIQSQGLFNDLAIRKLNFAQQLEMNGVLLWLVIGLTSSGVILAAFQLWMSYKFSEENNQMPLESKITLNTNGIVIRSSITGLLILVTSFSFFLVFVLYVYRFESPSKSQGEPHKVLTLPMGGLGKLPQVPK